MRFRNTSKEHLPALQPAGMFAEVFFLQRANRQAHLTSAIFWKSDRLTRFGPRMFIRRFRRCTQISGCSDSIPSVKIRAICGSHPIVLYCPPGQALPQGRSRRSVPLQGSGISRLPCPSGKESIRSGGSALSTDDLRCGLHLAAGDANLVDQLQLAPEVRAGDHAAQELRIPRHRPKDLVGAFIEEFHAK